MARTSKAATKEKTATNQEAVPQAEGAPVGHFVLKKNHGLTLHGRSSKHYAAGTVFDPATDGELISQLVRGGAIIIEVTEASEPAEQSSADDTEDEQSDPNE